MSDETDTDGRAAGEPTAGGDSTRESPFSEADIQTDEEITGGGETMDTPPGTEMHTMDDARQSTVSLDVTVDVSDLSAEDTAVLQKLAEGMEDAFTEMAAKNRDYSWSFLTTGAKLSNSEATPFDSAPRSQVYGLLTRSGDKRERLIENVYGDGSQTVSDEPYITARENANYWHFLSLVLQYPDLAAGVGGER